MSTQSATAPSLAWFNNELYLAFVNPTYNGNQIFISRYNGRNSESTFVGNCTSPYAPSLATYGDRLYLAFCDVDSRLMVCWSSDPLDDNSWSANLTATGHFSRQGPSLAVVPEELGVFGLYLGFIGHDDPPNVYATWLENSGRWSINRIDVKFGAEYPPPPAQSMAAPALFTVDYQLNAQPYLTAFWSGNPALELRYDAFLIDDAYAGWVGGGYRSRPDFPITSASAPGLAYAPTGPLVVAYQNADHEICVCTQDLNTEVGGLSWNVPKKIGQSCRYSPALAGKSPIAGGSTAMWMAFVGEDTGNLHICSSKDGVTWSSQPFTIAKVDRRAPHDVSRTFAGASFGR